MDVRHLELLRELAVRGTLAAVAAATYRTPSAVSQQLRTAEREIGVALVEPASRGVRLTVAGQILADGADEVLSAISNVQARADASIGKPAGVVTIGTLPSAGEALLPQLVRRLRATAITLRLDDFDLAEADFAARTLDFDIVIAHSLTGDIPAGAEELTSQVLTREPIDVAIPADHALAQWEVLRPSDVGDESWISVPDGYPFDSILRAIEATTGQRLQRRVRLRDNGLVESLVAVGEGLALLPRFTTAPRAGVVLRRLEGVPARRAIVALSRPDRHARLAVRTVTEALADIGESLSE